MKPGLQKKLSMQGTWRVLALTNPISLGGLSLSSPASQLTALKALDSIPPDISEKVTLSVKVNPNPRYAESELFSLATKSLGEKVLPLTTGLESVLEQVDLVVAVNYCGSALIHVLRYHKPAIFLFQHRKPCSLSKVRVQWLCHLDRRLKLPPRPICSNRSNWGTVRKRANVYSGHAYGPATGDRKWQSGLISTQQWTSKSLDLKTGGSSCPLGLSQSRPLWGRIFTYFSTLNYVSQNICRPL